jgi:hypothetical protein
MNCSQNPGELGLPSAVPQLDQGLNLKELNVKYPSRAVGPVVIVVVSPVDDKAAHVAHGL